MNVREYHVSSQNSERMLSFEDQSTGYSHVSDSYPHLKFKTDRKMMGKMAKIYQIKKGPCLEISIKKREGVKETTVSNLGMSMVNPKRG